MDFLKVLLDTFLSSLFLIGGAVATRVVYDPTGNIGEPQRPRTSFIDMYSGEQTVIAGGLVPDSGWVEIRSLGRQNFQLICMALTTGTRRLECIVDYAYLIDQKLEIEAQTRHALTDEIDYTNKPVLWKIPVRRTKGEYVRIRQINNLGDMTVTVEARGIGLMKPLLRTVEIVDREVVEG